LQLFVTNAPKITVFALTNRLTLGTEREYPTPHISPTLKEDETTFPETTLPVYQATRHHNPGDTELSINVSDFFSVSCKILLTLYFTLPFKFLCKYIIVFLLSVFVLQLKLQLREMDRSHSDKKSNFNTCIILYILIVQAILA
jgi:hypothetical protein